MAPEPVAVVPSRVRLPAGRCEETRLSLRPLVVLWHSHLHDAPAPSTLGLHLSSQGGALL